MHPARYLGLVNLSTPRDATQNLFPLLNCKSMTLSRPPNSKRSIFHYSWRRDGAEHLPPSTLVGKQGSTSEDEMWTDRHHLPVLT